MNTSWEYQTITFKVENDFGGPQLDDNDVKSRLNALGNEGWELVSMTPIKETGSRSTAFVLATLKRLKSA